MHIFILMFKIQLFHLLIHRETIHCIIIDYCAMVPRRTIETPGMPLLVFLTLSTRMSSAHSSTSNFISQKRKFKFKFVLCERIDLGKRLPTERIKFLNFYEMGSDQRFLKWSELLSMTIDFDETDITE